ncbi:hypothetical protein [Brevibacillus sp. SAFN-007a]
MNGMASTINKNNQAILFSKGHNPMHKQAEGRTRQTNSGGGRRHA